MHSCTDAKTPVPPVPCGNFLANYSLVKLPSCAREGYPLHVPTNTMQMYGLFQRKNDNYVRNQTCAKYSAQLLALVSTL